MSNTRVLVVGGGLAGSEAAWQLAEAGVAVELIEMPRFFSISIQSDVALWPPRRALTEPASRIAPPYSSSFSVSVVLPASGCEMIANVRRRWISWSRSDIRRVCGRTA